MKREGGKGKKFEEASKERKEAVKDGKKVDEKKSEKAPEVKDQKQDNKNQNLVQNDKGKNVKSDATETKATNQTVAAAP